MLLFCQNTEEKRQEVIQKLNRIKVKLDLVDLFKNNLRVKFVK